MSTEESKDNAVNCSAFLPPKSQVALGSLFEGWRESAIEPSGRGRRHRMEGHRLFLLLCTLQRGTVLVLAAVRAVKGDESVASVREVATPTALAIIELLFH